MIRGFRYEPSYNCYTVIVLTVILALYIVHSSERLERAEPVTWPDRVYYLLNFKYFSTFKKIKIHLLNGCTDYYYRR